MVLKKAGTICGLLASCIFSNVIARAQDADTKSLIVTPPVIGNIVRPDMFIMPSRNLVLGGNCSAQYLFRLDNLRPIETREEPGCWRFIVGEKAGFIIKSFNDGITVNSLDSGSRRDFIAGVVPYGLIDAGTLVDDDTSLIAAYSLKPDVYRLDLNTKSWRKLGSHRAGLGVESIAASASSKVGVSVARYPSKASEVATWDFTSNRKVAVFSAENATISDDGSLIALAIKNGEGKVRLEVRRFVGGQLVAQTDVANLDYEGYGKNLRHGSFVFHADGKSLSFLTKVDEGEENLELRTWDLGSNRIEARFKFSAAYLNDIVSIRSDLDSLLILKTNGVHRYSLSTSKPSSSNPTLASFEPRAAALSDDTSVLALSEGRRIVFVDTSSGGVARSFNPPAPKSDYCRDSCNIKHLAFVSRSKNLLFTDSDGAVTLLDTADGKSEILHQIQTNNDKSIHGFAVSSDSRLLAFTQDERLNVLDISKRSVIARFKTPKYVSHLSFVDNDLRILAAGFSTQVFDIAQGSKVLDYKSTFFVDKTRYYNTSARFITRSRFLGDSWIIGVSGAPGGQLLAYRNGQIVKHVGIGRPGRRYLAGQGDAATGYSSTQMIIGRGNELSITDPTFESWERISLHPAKIFFVARLASGNVISVSENGEVRIGQGYSRVDLVRTNLYSDDNWISAAPEGFFAGSNEALEKLFIRSGPTEVVPLENLYQALYRPDLVREKLAGDPKGLVREAAAKLDLNKVIASGAAPRVSIVSPSAGSVSDDEVTVEASITEQNGGGIGKIEWRVNGVTLGVETRGLERLPENTSASRPAITIKRRLALEPGENKIEVVAYNGRDLISSDPAQVTLKWDGEKSATPPKLHVLAVGVNDYYDSRLKLSYAVPDAKALGEALKRAGSSMYGTVEVTSVLDDKVTIDNLDKVFTEVSGKVHPRDVFVFFLAGHGKTVDGRYHFLPQNFRYEDESSIIKRGIDQERFQTWFAKIPARKSILLYDTCESGSLTGDRVQQRGIERVAALEKMTRAMGRTVLSASTDDAPALEGYRGHGVFTYALLDGLNLADTNGNGLIEVTELAAFIDQQVPDLSYQAFKMRQIPQMKIVGSSFPVVSRTSVLQVRAQIDGKPSAEIPSKPTHVVVSQSPIDVYVAAARGGAVVQQLPAGTLVTLVEAANGWQLIAKDGKKLGFVEDRMLARIQ